MQKLQQFMYGRYGGDKLNIALLALGLVFSLLGRIFFWPLTVLSYGALFYAIFRMFSRNIPARQKEYYAFLSFWSNLKGRFSGLPQQAKNRTTYKYFHCPGCKQKLRAPRGRGKIQVTCQKCHHVFVTKT